MTITEFDRLERSVESLAELVIAVQDKGMIDGWREYILDQARRSGIDNKTLAAAIKAQREKK